MRGGLGRWRLAPACLLVAGAASAAAAHGAMPDSSAMPAGDAARGRAIVVDRQVGMCLLCHSGPFPEERFQGDLAPDLSGVGARWTAAQLRERLVDPRRFNARTIMPSYARSAGLWRVAPAQRGRPLLTPQQIEDVIAVLGTLR
jgi:sulfur-oxidizing protein SoxX